MNVVLVILAAELLHAVAPIGAGVLFATGAVVLAAAYRERTLFERTRWQVERRERQESIETLRRLSNERRQNEHCHASLAD